MPLLKETIYDLSIELLNVHGHLSKQDVYDWYALKKIHYVIPSITTLYRDFINSRSLTTN